MAMARSYHTYEVRNMMQKAEGAASPVTGAPAHSRVLHAQSVGGGEGTTPALMMARTHKGADESNKQFSNRGGTTRTSAFGNLLHQSEAVCQALNSTKGQLALGVFDDKNHAAKKLRATIEFGPVKEGTLFSNAVNSPMKTVHKSDVSIQKPSGGAAGVRVILDRGANQAVFHIQTCMPLDTMPACKYEVKEGDTLIAGG